MLRNRSAARFAPNGLREPREACTPSYGFAAYNASARPVHFAKADPNEKFELGASTTPADARPNTGRQLAPALSGADSNMAHFAYHFEITN
jgi:hypothetical protein